MRVEFFFDHPLVNFVELLRWSIPTFIVSALAWRRTPMAPTSPQQRILVTRLDKLGDFIVFAPFLRELRRNYPNSNISLVAGEHVAPLAVPCPYVDDVFLLGAAPNRKTYSSYFAYQVAFVKYLK